MRHNRPDAFQGQFRPQILVQPHIIMKWQTILTHAFALLLAGFLAACDRNAYIGNPAPSPQLPGDVDLGLGYVRRDGAIHFLSGGTTGDGADATRRGKRPIATTTAHRKNLRHSNGFLDEIIQAFEANDVGKGQSITHLFCGNPTAPLFALKLGTFRVAGLVV